MAVVSLNAGSGRKRLSPANPNPCGPSLRKRRADIRAGGDDEWSSARFTVSQQLTDASPLSAGSKRLESLIKSALRFKPLSCHRTKTQKESANRPLAVQADSPSLSKVIQIIYLQSRCVHINRTLGQRRR